MNTLNIGITIGPITDTLLNMQRTRMVWAASYFFSYLAEEICKELPPALRANLIVPSEDFVRESVRGKYGEGRFTDRIYLKANSAHDLDIIRSTIDSVLEKTATSIQEHIVDTKFGYDDFKGGFPTKLKVLDALKRKFYIYIVEAEANGLNFPIEEINKVAGSTEYRVVYDPDSDYDPIAHFLYRVNKRKKGKLSFLMQHSQSIIENARFKSLIEIAATGLSIVNKAEFNKIVQEKIITPESSEEDTGSEDDYESIIGKFKDSFKEFRNYHKYIAVVMADGDGMNTKVKDSFDDSTVLEKLTTDLSEFCTEGVEKGVNYGAEPVFAGGDDLFFFAPVAALQTGTPPKLKSVFDMILDIEKEFKTKLHDSTLSWGIAIGYYKHPLKDFVKIADDNLNNKAKAAKKNKIAVSFQKHSGQRIDFIIDKNNGNWEKILQTIHELINIPDNEHGKNEQLMSGIIHELNDPTFAHLLDRSTSFSEGVGSELESAQKNCLVFLENMFNEPIHKTCEGKKFLKLISDLSVQCKDKDSSGNSSKFSQLYGLLRIVHFILSKDERN